MRLAPALAAALVALVAALSFGLNAFRTAPQARFSEPPFSDALVTDGWRAGADALGYVLPEGFVAYPSSFGGQLDLYRLLALPGLDLPAMTAVNALLLAALVALATLVAGRRILGGAGALAFGLWLALSPWLVLFAGSLYWVTWLTLLPFVLALLLGDAPFRSGRPFLVCLLVFFPPLLARFLCGYEFASTIAIYAAAPLVWFAFARAPPRRAVWPAARAVAGVAAASVAAMAVAMALHAARVEGSLSRGIERIAVTVEKRLASADPAAVAEAACREVRHTDPDECAAKIVRSLRAPLPLVVGTYLTFRGNVPWLGGPDILDDPALAPLRRALRRGDMRGAAEALRPLGLTGLLATVNLAATAALSWMLVAAALVLVWRVPGERTATLLMLAAAAAAPLSWYVIAAAHSYGHMQINFVLWAPFLALAAGVVTARAAAAWRGRRRRA